MQHTPPPIRFVGTSYGNSFYRTVLEKWGDRHELPTVVLQAADAAPAWSRRSCDRIGQCKSRSAAAGVLSSPIGRQQDQAGCSSPIRQRSSATRQSQRAVGSRADAASAQLPARQRNRQWQPFHAAYFPYCRRHRDDLDRRLWRAVRLWRLEQLRLFPAQWIGGLQQLVPLLDCAVPRRPTANEHGKIAPAPWVAFTRAGCDVGAFSTANIEFERIPGDVNTVFGATSKEGL